MKREFLSALGLEKELIDKILDENCTDIGKTKEEANGQITELTSQLTTAKDTLKSFEGVDVKELQGKITQLSGDLTTKETEYQSKLADIEFQSALDSSIAASKAKNAKAVKALLDLDSLKQSKNQAEDTKAALMAITKENPYLFGEVEDNPPPGAGDVPKTFTKEEIIKMSPSEINQNWDSVQKSL